jgi:hypothetical protein
MAVQTGSFNAAVSIGDFRKRLPVAAKIALRTAGAMAEVMRHAFGQPPQVIRRKARVRKPRRELGAMTSYSRVRGRAGFADLKLPRRGSISTL